MEAHGRFCINFSACNIQIPHVSTGYTKHYFAGTERLASAIGNDGLADVGHPIAPQQSPFPRPAAWQNYG